jgi:hypothetical protein
MITSFIFATTILMALMGIIWEKSNWLNVTLKMLFLGLAVFGVYIIIHRDLISVFFKALGN